MGAEVFNLSDTPIQYFKGTSDLLSDFSFKGSENMRILGIRFEKSKFGRRRCLLETSPFCKDKRIVNFDMEASAVYGFSSEKY